MHKILRIGFFLCILLPNRTHTKYNFSVMYVVHNDARACVGAIACEMLVLCRTCRNVVLLSPYLVVANRTYVFAREHSTRLPCIHSIHQLCVCVSVASFCRCFVACDCANKMCFYTQIHRKRLHIG